MGTTSAISRSAFFAFLPAVAPYIDVLKEESILEILDLANQCSSPEMCGRFLGAISPHCAAGRKVVVPIARFAAGAARSEELKILDGISAIALCHEGEPDPHAGQFVNAMPAWEEFPRIYGETVWPAALRLILAVSAQCCSSGEYLLRKLPKTIGGLGNNIRLNYLVEFHSAIEVIGIRAVRFGLRTLPDLYIRHDAARVRAFVAGAVATANQCGPTAGDWFLDRKTSAARAMLPNKE
jgi:hypothetical protein